MKCYRFNRKCEPNEGIEINLKNKKLEGFSGNLEIMNSDDSPYIDTRNVSLYIPNFEATYLFRTDIVHNKLKRDVLVLKKETEETKKDILLYFSGCVSKSKDISEILAIDENQDAGPISSFPKMHIIEALKNSEERLKNYNLKMLFVLPRNHKIIMPIESEIYNDENRWLRNLENKEGTLRYFEEKKEQIIT